MVQGSLIVRPWHCSRRIAGLFLNCNQNKIVRQVHQKQAVILRVYINALKHDINHTCVLTTVSKAGKC